MKELQAIENYVVYLIRECGLSVTIHPIETETLITFSSLMHFNTHANPYCTHVKSTKEGYERCLLQQRKVLGRLKQQEHPLCGPCHAGVLEYVYPLRNDRGVIGFVSVSGYATKEGASRIPQTAKEFGYAEPVLQKAYGTLCGTIPDRERIDTLIAPLCMMLELAYRKERGEEKKEDMLHLLSLGLLKDGEGKLSDDTRNKVLDALGYGSLENARDITNLHLKKAERENILLAQQDVEADEYDDHALHITEHTRALLSGGEENKATKERIMRHLSSHRRREGEKI